MTTTLSPNETLMGLEATAREDFEAAVTGAHYHREKVWDAGAFATHETDGLLFIVTYYPVTHRLSGWTYEFTQCAGGLRGKFDSRDACLVALDWHMAVAA